MAKKTTMSKKTKKLLYWALWLFAVTLFLFLFIIMKYRVKSDVILVMFLLYGAVYAGWFWLCTQIAHKLKNLKLGIVLFLLVLILAFAAFWWFASGVIW